jgi:hypothetical protein
LGLYCLVKIKKPTLILQKRKSRQGRRQANALSTSIMVLGHKKGRRLLRQFPDYQCLMMADNGKLYTSRNLPRKQVQPWRAAAPCYPKRIKKATAPVAITFFPKNMKCCTHSHSCYFAASALSIKNTRLAR